MSPEVFDVVNDRDHIVGKRFRGDVHRLGLMHRAVHVLVLNSKGHLYLQKRSHQKDTFPGAWDSSASGHVGTGENYDRTAVRELHEEIGVIAKRAPQRLFKVEARAETGQEFVWVYTLQHDGPFRINPAEVEFAAFFRVEDVDRWMAERPRDFADAFRLIWKWFRHGRPKEKAKPPIKKPKAKKQTRPAPLQPRKPSKPRRPGKPAKPPRAHRKPQPRGRSRR